MALKLGLFIPIYNVEAYLGDVLKRVPESVWPQLHRIYIFDNASSDGSIEVAHAFAKARPELPIQIFRNQKNCMLGGSTMLAFEHALADEIDYLICLHGDGQAPPESLPEFIARCAEQRYDFILGSRLMPGVQRGEYSLARWSANLAFAYLQQWIVGQKVYDVGAYIAFNLHFIRQIPYRAFAPDMGYHPNLILTSCLIAKPAPRFSEFPIAWGRVESSNVNVVSYSFIHLLRLMRLMVVRPRLDRDFGAGLKSDLV